MKFSDFVCYEAINANATATTKEAIIREMVQSLLNVGKIPGGEVEGILKAIMKREELGSTGIGRGVAVPHTKHPSVNKLIGTVAISKQGIDFESLDGEKVQLLFLLVSRPIGPGIICERWRISPDSCGMMRFARRCGWPRTPKKSKSCSTRPTLISMGTKRAMLNRI